MKHGQARRGVNRSPEYRAWSAMNSRCHNRNDDRYSYYGKRGIAVWPGWRTPAGFPHFLAEVGRRPSSQYSLDRIKNNLGYIPGNVRWATRKTQANNRKNGVMITLEGKKQTLAQWCDELERKYSVVWDRIYRYKWTKRRALLTPTRTT